MRDLFQKQSHLSKNQKAKLKTMLIPGSHDSASYSISDQSIGSGVGKCQNVSVKEQLLAGVRFLDLRIASGKTGGGLSGVNIFHGCMMGCPFEVVLDEILWFVKQFPKEFIILHVVAEYGRPFSVADKVKALDLMRDRFGRVSQSVPDRLLCKVKTRHELLSNPLEDVVKKKGRVLVLLMNRIYDDFIIRGVEMNEDAVRTEFGFIDSSLWLRNKWHNTMDTLELLESNLREIRAHKTHSRRYFVNNQFVLTPAFRTNNLFGLLTGSKSIQPVHLANWGLYQPPKGSHGRGVPVLHEIFLGHQDEDWNVLSLDFVDLAPAIIDLWIGMNFGSLEIELALLGNLPKSRAFSTRRSAEDVTELVRSRILRGSSLFLHPMHEFDPDELAANPGASLTVVYRVSKKLFSVVVPLRELATTQVVVLNEHNHKLAGGTELTIGSVQGNGRIDDSRQKRGPVVTWQKTENRSLRFGYLEEDNSQKLALEFESEEH